LKKQNLLLLLLLIPVSGIFLISNPKVQVNSASTTISVLYIFGNYTTLNYPGYDSLFASNPFISLTGINITDFMVDSSIASAFDAIIVGHSSFDSWENPNNTKSTAIIDSGKPILSLGQGGATFFQGLGYKYGGSAMGFTGNGLAVNSSDSSHGIFNGYYSFNIPGNITYSAVYTLGVYMMYSGFDQNTSFLAADHDSNTNHSPLLENLAFSQKTIHFGVGGVPTDDQSNFYKLIHNCLEYLTGSVFVDPTTTSTTTLPPTSTTTPTSTVPSSNTTPPTSTTTPSSTTESSSEQSSTTKSTTTDDSVTTTEDHTSTTTSTTTNLTLNITPGFGSIVILFSIVVIIPVRRYLKRK
jgi:hypothetical protein